MTAERSRPIELVRAIWGAALLLVPRPVMEHLPQVRVDSKSLTVARILGARQLTQATLSGLNPTPEVLAMGVWVDAAHALTALGLALADRPRSRAGLIDAAVASTWAVLGYRDITKGPTPASRHEHRRDQVARLVLSRVPGGRPLRRRAEGARGHALDGGRSEEP